MRRTAQAKLEPWWMLGLLLRLLALDTILTFAGHERSWRREQFGAIGRARVGVRTRRT